MTGETELGARRRGQLTIYWWSPISEVEEPANQSENDQQVVGRAGGEAEASYTYDGQAMDDFAGESGDNHMRVPFSHGRLVQIRCILGRADSITRGHVDPSSCAACRFKWAGGSRPPHPAEFVRGLPISEPEKRWAT